MRLVARNPAPGPPAGGRATYEDFGPIYCGMAPAAVPLPSAPRCCGVDHTDCCEPRPEPEPPGRGL